MTEVQRRATAAGFLHALHSSPEVFKEWHPIKKDDYSALGKLIQKTVGLSEAPSKDDIHAMATYIDGHMKDEADKFAASHADAAHHVGVIALMQQS
jgi:hypothetical protein